MRTQSRWMLVGVVLLIAPGCGGEEAPTPTKITPLEVAANPPGRTFQEMTTTVELAASRPAEIFYTIDGQDPIGASALVYTGPLVLEQNTLVTFIAVSEDGIWSEPQTERYTFPVEATRVNPVERGLAIDRNNHFFSVEPGNIDRVATTFTLRSVGLRTVNVSNIYIGVNPKGWGFFEDGIFRLENTPTELALAPGETLTITLSYQPTQTLRSAALVIESDDLRSEDGYVLVELWGRVITW